MVYINSSLWHSKQLSNLILTSVLLCLLCSNSPPLADDATYGFDGSDEAYTGPVTYSSGPVFRSGYNVVTRTEVDDDDDDDDDAVVRAYYASAPVASQQKSIAVQTYSAPVSYAAAPTVYSVPQPAVYSVAQPTTYSVRTAVPSSGSSFYSFGAQPTYFRSSDNSGEVSPFYSGVPTVYSASAPVAYSAPQFYSAPQATFRSTKTYSAPTFYSGAPQGYVYYGDDDDDRFDFD